MRPPKLTLNQSDIATIVSRQAWQGSGAPSWPQAKAKSEVVALSKKWVKRLRRKDRRGSLPTPEMLALADKLANCGPNTRCGSGSCPMCGRAVQRWAVAQVLRLVAP